jgi:hypothetical protein
VRPGRGRWCRRWGGPRLADVAERAPRRDLGLADAYAANVLPVIREIRRSGATSLHKIAEALNARGITTPRGGQWYAKSVNNVLARGLDRLTIGRHAPGESTCRACLTLRNSSAPKNRGDDGANGAYTNSP